MIATHDVDRGTHQASSFRGRGLFLILLDRHRELRIDEAAVVARAVGQLGGAALGAADVVDRLEGVMRAALSLAHLADSLDRLHGRDSCLTSYTGTAYRFSPVSLKRNKKATAGSIPAAPVGPSSLGENVGLSRVTDGAGELPRFWDIFIAAPG